MPIIDGSFVNSTITINVQGVIIDGFEITHSSDSFQDGAGIKINEGNSKIINNIIIRNAGYGILSRGSKIVDIIGNNISYNERWGIWAPYSNYMNISKNIFITKEFEIAIYMGLHYGNNIINENKIYGGRSGIYLWGNDYNEVKYNEISNVINGIVICQSDFNEIIGNNLHNNSIGLDLGGYRNRIIANNISNNERGITSYLNSYNQGSNTLYHNNLVNNNINAIDGYNETNSFIQNEWDSGLDGNYYSNLIGDDVNGDGRIDTPYFIPGGCGVDRYPLVAPYSSPLPRFNAEIISPEDGSIFFDYENISFEGTSSYGFEPLNYSWITSVSGIVKYVYEANDIPTEYYSNEQSFNQTLEGGSWLVYFKIKDDNGRVVDNYHNIVVLGPFLELNAGVKYNRIGETIDISAYAINRHLGEDVTSGVAKFDILDINNVTTGITGDLSYNLDSGYWEIENFYVPNLEDGDYKVHILLYDSTGYGAIDSPFLKMDGNGVVQGYLLNGPQSSDTKIITIPETEVSLFSSYNYFLKKGPVAVTTTDTNGKFEFNDVEPGLYVLNSTIPNQNMIGVSDSFRVGNTIALQNLTLFYKADIFNNEIKELKEKYIEVMDYETMIISEISQRYHEDIDEDPSYLSYMLSVVDAAFEVALSGEIDNGAVFIYEVCVIKQIPFMGYLGINTLASDLLNEAYGYTFSEIKSNHDQHYVSINQAYGNYVKAFNEIEVSNDFDTIGAKGLLTNLNYQLSLVSNEDTKVRMIIPFSPSEKNIVLNLPSSKKLYIDTAIAKNEFESVELGNQFAIVSGKIFAYVYANDKGVPIPIVSAPLEAFETYVEVESVKIETSFKQSLARMGIILVGSWNNDMDRIENSYKNNIDFLIKEMENPKYLNKNNKFDLEVDVISQPQDLIESEDINIPILSNLWASGQVDKEMELNIKNMGNVDSIVRVSWNGKWDYDPKIKGKISSDEKRTFETAIGSSKQELAPNEVGSFTIPYSGFFQAGSFLGTSGPNPHSLTVMAFSGPFQEYSHTFFYVVTDPELNLTSSRTESGILTVEELSEYTPKISTIISDELTINNPTTTANFKTSDDTQTLMLMMDSFIGIPIELHVYDSSGKHVGYDVNTDKIAIEFPASYYGEIYNPEKIIIPNAGNKSFTIIARLPYLYDQIESSIEVYALENPRRPPILSVSNMHINKLVGNNQTVLIDLSIAESGGQHPIHNVNATIRNITKDGIELPLLSPQKIIIGDLSAGSTGIATFILDIPATITDGNYTGIINVDSEIGPYPVNVTIQVTSKADLKISYIDVNRMVCGGDYTNITVFAENQGFTNVANTKLELLVDDVPIESSVLEIPSEYLEVHTFNWTAVTGNHIIKARIDSDNTTEEFNEDNNEFEVSTSN
jgi:parallel beta-helix repeat protein